MPAVLNELAELIPDFKIGSNTHSGKELLMYFSNFFVVGCAQVLRSKCIASFLASHALYCGVQPNTILARSQFSVTVVSIISSHVKRSLSKKRLPNLAHHLAIEKM
jgi:hypothetical protein